jgi:hypothetical protein
MEPLTECVDSLCRRSVVASFTRNFDPLIPPIRLYGVCKHGINLRAKFALPVLFLYAPLASVFEWIPEKLVNIELACIG